MPDSIPVQDLSPTVHEALSVLGSEPVKMLVTGGVGTGKSTLLGAVRDALRGAGSAVVTRAPADGGPTDAAVVVDDAHLLPAVELQRLAAVSADPSSTVVVAVQPRDHDEDLQALMTSIERERPRISLGPMTSAEISRRMTDPSGHPPRTELVTSIVVATAGIPFLVDAALAPPRPYSAASIGQAALFALNDRLRRLAEPDLDALLIASLSRDLGAADLAATLQVSPDEARLLIDRARATGLIEPAHSPHFLRAVHRAVAQILGNARHHDVETALLRSQIAMNTLSPDLALRLAEHGVRDEQLAEVLRRQACAGRADPALLRAAVDAGAVELRAQLADALALAGESSAAASEADSLLASDDPAERAAAVRVAASVAMLNGNSAQASELFSWLGPYPDTSVSAAATIVLTGAGDAAGAERALAVPSAGPPTAASRAARTLAEGLLATLQGPYSTAATKLGAAMAAEYSAAQVLPDSPAALVTLAALHGGDPVRARSVIARAVRADRDADEPLYGHRHRLLLGWTKMQDGQFAAAAADIAGLDGTHRRDALWTAALRTALARRGGDAGALQKHWYAAMEVLVEYSVDLFSLLPLGELWVASARLGQQDRLAPALEQAFGLLESLGNPPTWSVPLRWAGVHAGILAGDPAAVAPHGQALTAAAAHSPFAKALAVAGRTWLRVLAGQVEGDEVGAAARGLAQFGLTADATRLAGQAALQTSDPKVSGLMLQVARDLKLSAGDSGGEDGRQPLVSEASGPTPAGARQASSPLSDREREVAELLLLGMPYRDIGAQLFISAKTVEHHVARIRRRLGAESRSEMLSMLRAILSPQS
ncbi:helix-turn-helix transcriptional regulator [Mycobacterium sp. ENV421]|uniref:isoniazid response ATPase/transcriptional regulator IniR n=1 Tax=Mycobacterium sp. ENV421 TaxID=1213407 RepID=UPI000C9B5674|nr:isoniazid response ATPase/transcriptional regulator IniR [Mycobacterium sp. ENV421]PND59520.1 helix-turn-helix transcriptional regulator [Mycobacterium sp. ENV421]